MYYAIILPGIEVFHQCRDGRRILSDELTVCISVCFISITFDTTNWTLMRIGIVAALICDEDIHQKYPEVLFSICNHFFLIRISLKDVDDFKAIQSVSKFYILTFIVHFCIKILRPSQYDRSVLLYYQGGTNEWSVMEMLTAELLATFILSLL